MDKKIQISKHHLEELIDLADMFRDVSMSSYYSTDIHLQEDDVRLDNLIQEIKDNT